MDPEEYFERVIRFLETKGWNTSRTQVNESIYIVTGTRKSDTYYDRMMTMIGIDTETTFDDTHLNYLVDAASEHDVDQLLATCRGGIDEEATDLLGTHGIEFIEPETIDDAFIDEFQIEREDGIFEQARATGSGLGSDQLRRTVGSLLALSLIAGIVFGLAIAVLGTVSGPSEQLGAILAAGLVLVGPLLAFVGTLALVASEQPSAPAGIFLGAVFGYLLFVLVVGASGGLVDLTASTALFDSPAGAFAVFALSIPTGIGAVAVAYAYVSLG
jgi:hypothetical protein